jgi:hypothetical protein
MTWFHIVYWYLWLAPHALLIVIAILMVRRDLHKEFPVFFSYLVYEVLSCGIYFATYLRQPPYSILRQVDLFARAGDAALHFAILRELFEPPLTNNPQLRQRMARFSNWTTALLAFLSVAFVWFTHHKTPGLGLLSDYVVVEGCNLTQCALVALVFLWYRFLNIGMPPFALGIALGLGLITAMEPVVFILKDSATPPVSRIVDLVHMGTYHVAVLIWLYYVQVRETPGVPPGGSGRPPGGDPPPLRELQDWAVGNTRTTNL